MAYEDLPDDARWAQVLRDTGMSLPYTPFPYRMEGSQPVGNVQGAYDPFGTLATITNPQTGVNPEVIPAQFLPDAQSLGGTHVTGVDVMKPDWNREAWRGFTPESNWLFDGGWLAPLAAAAVGGFGAGLFGPGAAAAPGAAAGTAAAGEMFGPPAYLAPGAETAAMESWAALPEMFGPPSSLAPATQVAPSLVGSDAIETMWNAMQQTGAGTFGEAAKALGYPGTESFLQAVNPAWVQTAAAGATPSLLDKLKPGMGNLGGGNLGGQPQGTGGDSGPQYIPTAKPFSIDFGQPAQQSMFGSPYRGGEALQQRIRGLLWR